MEFFVCHLRPERSTGPYKGQEARQPQMLCQTSNSPSPAGGRSCPRAAAVRVSTGAAAAGLGAPLAAASPAERPKLEGRPGIGDMEPIRYWSGSEGVDGPGGLQHEELKAPAGASDEACGEIRRCPSIDDPFEELRRRLRIRMFFRMYFQM